MRIDAIWLSDKLDKKFPVFSREWLDKGAQSEGNGVFARQVCSAQGHGGIASKVKKRSVLNSSGGKHGERPDHESV